MIYKMRDSAGGSRNLAWKSGRTALFDETGEGSRIGAADKPDAQLKSSVVVSRKLTILACAEFTAGHSPQSARLRKQKCTILSRLRQMLF